MSPSDPHFLLHAQFLDQARRTPDQVALIEAERSVTYRQLESQTGRAAAALASRGISRGSTVALHAERSIEWVTGVLAILRTQAAVLPLPPSYPLERRRSILEHAKPDAVVSCQAWPLEEALGVTALDLGSLCGGADSPAPESSAADPDQAALVLCSSGSTGLPKMIVRSHRSFFHRLTWTWTRHPYEQGEVCCHKAHPTTTHGIYELFEPLLRGVPVVILPDPVVRDLEQFWSTLASRSISRLLIVPSMMQASLDMPGFVPPPLEVVVLMGEYLPAPLARRIVEAFPAATRLYSIYGSTEASSTLVCDLRDPVPEGRELPLGRPITPDTGVHVLSAALEPVPPGEVGRLFISGPALFAGYFGSDELTAAVVATDPRSGARMYDTRDDVRRMPDGLLEFVGRADDTVKIRGFRVELAEVERALQSHLGVGQAAVAIAGADGPGAALVGFYTPSTVPAAEVYETLRNRLPAYMIPATLVGLDAFPLTERGKLDRRRLLEESPAGADNDGGATSPMSDVERRVAEVWASTLGHRRFRRDSSFFEVGGTSLTTFVLVHRLREAFALDRDRLGEAQAYRYPTIESMARHLAGGAEPAGGSAAITASTLVTLRQATDPSAPPLFVIASAGGTVGAYQKLVAAMRHPGEIIGVRDPFIAGERDPTGDFQQWVGCYLAAIRARQPAGPYYLAAYSSAGAFGYEIARHLRREGQQVGLLALIDPLGIGGCSRKRFGWWVWHATELRPAIRIALRLAAWFRRPLAGWLRRRAAHHDCCRFAVSEAEFRKLAGDAAKARGHLFAVAALMELNTGLPLDLTDCTIPPDPPDGVLRALKARVAQHLPEVDGETIERIVVQYALQVVAQRAYCMVPCDAPVLLAEPDTGYARLLDAQLRPYVSHLHIVRIPLGTPDDRVRALTARFGELAPHFRSMRDAQFVEVLARALDEALQRPAAD